MIMLMISKHDISVISLDAYFDRTFRRLQRQERTRSEHGDAVRDIAVSPNPFKRFDRPRKWQFDGRDECGI